MYHHALIRYPTSSNPKAAFVIAFEATAVYAAKAANNTKPTGSQMINLLGEVAAGALRRDGLMMSVTLSQNTVALAVFVRALHQIEEAT